jgi:hypothetical protein
VPRFSVYQLGRGSDPVIVVGRILPAVAFSMSALRWKPGHYTAVLYTAVLDVRSSLVETSRCRGDAWSLGALGGVCNRVSPDGRTPSCPVLIGPTPFHFVGEGRAGSDKASSVNPVRRHSLLMRTILSLEINDVPGLSIDLLGNPIVDLWLLSQRGLGEPRHAHEKHSSQSGHERRPSVLAFRFIGITACG